MILIEVINMKTKSNDFGTQLAQEIIQFANSKNMKVRKKRRLPITGTSKNTINKH
ncbi:hypothetical protein SAMN04488601_11717 [Paenibacillus sp. 453mf]|nr:hypothetical protein SAMN04488601_11717 [Paenibacillus sp. 453mf]